MGEPLELLMDSLAGGTNRMISHGEINKIKIETLRVNNGRERTSKQDEVCQSTLYFSVLVCFGLRFT